MRLPRVGGRGPWRPGLLTVWHALGVACVVLVPSLVALGRPFWELQPGQALQVPVLAAAYLMLALILTALGSSERGFSLAGAVVSGAVVFGLAGLVLVLLGFPLSRRVAAATFALGMPLALAPAVFTRGAHLASGLLAVVALAAGVVSGTGSEEVAAEDPLRYLAHHTVRLREHPDLLPASQASGGAIAPMGASFLVATGAGDLVSVEWQEHALVSEPLPLRVPMNRAAFIEDHDTTAARHFRVTGLVLDTTVAPTRLYVAHLHWNREDECVTQRVSATPLMDAVGSSGDWRTVFETSPCIELAERSAASTMTGGRLAWGTEGDLLLSVGDHGHAGTKGTRPILREDGTAYGKILRVVPDSGYQVVSRGHRNPQGLVVTRAGDIWATEHGPQGGDELNRIRMGGDYGWPYATYGTEYEAATWPLADGRRDHAGYDEPAYAWVPSVGISSLIEVGDAQFPLWKGDLLVGSLIGRTLFRVRVREDRVIYSEPINVGRRVRDLAEGADGRVVVLTDSGLLLSLSEARLVDRGRVAYGQCAGCHESGGALGPELRDIFEQPVAGDDSYPYSSALQELDAHWTSGNLDAFLQDPQGFAPGTTMVFEGVADPETRSAIIEFLKGYR